MRYFVLAGDASAISVDAGRAADNLMNIKSDGDSLPLDLMADSLFVQAHRLDLPAYMRPLLPPFCSASVEISRLTKI